jgi:hypothetical protein
VCVCVYVCRPFGTVGVYVYRGWGVPPATSCRCHPELRLCVWGAWKYPSRQAFNPNVSKQRGTMTNPIDLNFRLCTKPKQVRLEAGESGIGIEIEIDSAQFCASVRLDTDTDFDFDFDFDFKLGKPQLGLCA